MLIIIYQVKRRETKIKKETMTTITRFFTTQLKVFSLSRSDFIFFIIYYRRWAVLRSGLRLYGFIEFFLSFLEKKIVNKSTDDDSDFVVLYPFSYIAVRLWRDTIRISRVVILSSTRMIPVDFIGRIILEQISI